MTSIFVFLAGLFMWVTEHLRPAHVLPKSRRWWPRTLVLHAGQALVVFAAGRLLDPVLAPLSLASVRDLPNVAAAAIGYVVLTFVYYWWHRARHEVPFLWRHVHQMHHSPVRLEVWTSFYKHPTELFANALISSSTMFLLLGLSPAQAGAATLLSGLAELFYHWNVRTPRWLGWWLQRPEMHRVHHQRGRHRHNYGDLPIWDILFGTFHNPELGPAQCGFGHDGENRVLDLLAGVDVCATPSRPGRWRGVWRGALVLAVGSLGVVAQLSGYPPLKGVVTAAQLSPAPKVFTSHRGVETFSGQFAIESEDPRGRPVRVIVDRHAMKGMRGPYNRRNVYGAVFAYVPALHDSEAFMAMAVPVAQAGLCGDAPLLREVAPGVRLGADARRRLVVTPDQPAHKPFVWEVPCPRAPQS